MFKKIVLGLDGSETSDKALSLAGDLARESDGQIVAVHITERITGRHPAPIHADEDDIVSRIRKQVQDLADGGVKAELQVASTMTEGAARVIADLAESESADLIVTGSRGHSALAGIFVNSVSHKLLHAATCPILVVPEAHKE